MKPNVKKNGGYSRRLRANILTAQGEITEALGHDNYRVELDNGITILATLSGKMRQNNICVIVGDRVELELSAYDLTRGRITRRFKVKQNEY
jgi:translation initiation factor IF-1